MDLVICSIFFGIRSAEELQVAPSATVQPFGLGRKFSRDGHAFVLASTCFSPHNCHEYLISKSFGSIFLEASLVRAIAAQSLKSQPGESQPGSQHSHTASERFDFRCSLSQDIANQIRHWDQYTQSLREHGAEAGMYLNPRTAEWFSGAACLFNIQC